jgi:hypothetical protein
MNTLAWVLERKSELLAERDKTVGNLNAISGALQFCDMLMVELERDAAAQPTEEKKDEQSAQKARRTDPQPGK